MSVRSIISKEHGSALSTVLVISTIILLLIGGIFLGIRVQMKFMQRDVNSTKALYQAEANIYKFLRKNTASVHEGIYKIDAENSLTVKPFGGFWDITSESSVSGRNRKVRVLTGDKSGGLYKSAVLLGDSTSNITLTGTTLLNGNIFTYGEGIRESGFKGIPFRGNFSGDQRHFDADTTFPEFSTEIFHLQFDQFKNIRSSPQIRRFMTNYRGEVTKNLKTGDTLYYEEDTEWIERNIVTMPMDLVIIVDGNFTINGNYTFKPFTKIIVSDTLLVGGSVTGKNILLYAGKSLQIGGGVSVSTQALSEGNIVVRDNAYLEYPSLVFSSQETYEGGAKEVINITGDAVIDGTVVYPFRPSGFTQEFLKVKIDTNAIVRGSIYNNGQTELSGKILGTAMTYQFYFYESPTTYVNWLKDVTIDVSQRPENFILPIGFTDSAKYTILDWYEISE